MVKGDFSTFLKQERNEATLLFLFIHFLFHPSDSRLKEEGNQRLIRAFCTDETQSLDILFLAFLGNDDNGMSFFMKNEVGK